MLIDYNNYNYSNNNNNNNNYYYYYYHLPPYLPTYLPTWLPTLPYPSLPSPTPTLPYLPTSNIPNISQYFPFFLLDDHSSCLLWI